MVAEGQVSIYEISFLLPEQLFRGCQRTLTLSVECSRSGIHNVLLFALTNKQND